MVIFSPLGELTNVFNTALLILWFTVIEKKMDMVKMNCDANLPVKFSRNKSLSDQTILTVPELTLLKLIV